MKLISSSMGREDLRSSELKNELTRLSILKLYELWVSMNEATSNR